VVAAESVQVVGVVAAKSVQAKSVVAASCKNLSGRLSKVDLNTVAGVALYDHRCD